MLCELSWKKIIIISKQSGVDHQIYHKVLENSQQSQKVIAFTSVVLLVCLPGASPCLMSLQNLYTWRVGLCGGTSCGSSTEDPVCHRDMLRSSRNMNWTVLRENSELGYLEDSYFYHQQKDHKTTSKCEYMLILM